MRILDLAFKDLSQIFRDRKSALFLVLNFVVGLKVASGTLLVMLILLESLQKGEPRVRD